MASDGLDEFTCQSLGEQRIQIKDLNTFGSKWGLKIPKIRSGFTSNFASQLGKHDYTAEISVRLVINKDAMRQVTMTQLSLNNSNKNQHH